MDKIVIVGGKKLSGEVKVSGSKNAALPCLFATLLTDEPCVLTNVPNLKDIDTTCRLLTQLGKKILRKGDVVEVYQAQAMQAQASYELVRQMRASALVLGPLLARLKTAAAALPGGCAIGVRPIDIHLKGFEALGAQSQIKSGMIHLSAEKLSGKRFRLPFASVGATENLLMAAALAQGTTVLLGAAREPEIVDLADCLNAMGAKISGAGSAQIKIEGCKKLHGARHRVIADRIEAATYLIAAAATGGSVTLTGAEPRHIQNILLLLKRSGVPVAVAGDKITTQVPRKLTPVSVKTQVYPGFPTDVQAQWMALMTQAQGKSTIEETIFENRFLHAAELCRMGASIQVAGRRAKITGPTRLSGADVMVSDLRAGAALVIAALMAEGKSTVHRIYHLDRGYEDLEKKFRSLGADIQRQS